MAQMQVRVRGGLGGLEPTQPYSMARPPQARSHSDVAGGESLEENGQRCDAAHFVVLRLELVRRLMSIE